MDYDEVLRLINVARQACGKDVLAAIRNGAPSEPLSCPIAASLNGGDVAVEFDYAAFKSEADAEKVREAWGTGIYDGGTQVLNDEITVFGYEDGDRVPRSHTAVLPELLKTFVIRYDQGVVPYDVAHDPREEQ